MTQPTPDPQQGPADPFPPLSNLDEMAVQQHEMVEAYVRAGFTRAEGITMMLTMFTAYAQAKAAENRRKGL